MSFELFKKELDYSPLISKENYLLVEKLIENLKGLTYIQAKQVLFIVGESLETKSILT